MNAIIEFFLILILSGVITFTVVFYALNFTRTGDAILRAAFGKKETSRAVSFDTTKSIIFILLMFVLLFGSTMLAKSSLWGIALLGVVTGLYTAVIGTQRYQEKQKKKTSQAG